MTFHEQKVEQDPSLTTTRGSLRRRKGLDSIYATPRIMANSFSLANLQARTPTIGREAAMLKNVAVSVRERRNVRLARLKPGFVIGVLGGTSRVNNGGDHVAVTPCRLHHLAQADVYQLEQSNPRLILELFKMMVSTLISN